MQALRSLAALRPAVSRRLGPSTSAAAPSRSVFLKKHENETEAKSFTIVSCVAPLPA
jgi:hypothetical protein